MLKYAIEYLSRGWSVIPIAPRSKQPPGKFSWKEFQERRATESEVRKWWDEWPQANIGIATGKVSGIVVLDLDTMLAMETAKENGIPRSPTAATGSGYHVYLKHPGFSVLNAVKLGDVKGLDVRGDGGYVVVPPSIHPSGRRYKWTARNLDTPVADCPEWLVEILKNRTNSEGATGGADKSWLLKLLPGIEQGSRNSDAARTIGHWLGLGLPEEEVWVLAMEWNKRNNPPLDKKELEGVFVSILSRERAKHKSQKNTRLPGRVAVPAGWDGVELVVTGSWNTAKDAYFGEQAAVIVVYPDGKVPREAVAVLQQAKNIRANIRADDDLTWQLYPLLAQKGVDAP
ncbi:MAG: bifunctional DNA primase/polymerase [Syntrophaceticus sp.]|jgi:hypothetical protein